MRRYRLVLAVVVAGVALTAAACGGDDSAGSSSTTAGPGATTASTTTTTAEPSGEAALEGTWAIDAGELLRAGTANVGGTGGSTCSGRVTLTFADGTLQRAGNITCGAGTGTIDTTSKYKVDGDKLIVSDTSSRSSYAVRGVSIPLPDNWGNSVATYKVVDDVLTITFTQASVGTVTSKYTRVS